jgi:hypothetical protein
MPAKCEQLVESYLAWLRDRMSVADIDGTCEITTPFLDRHNDRMQIYVVPTNGSLRLTDDSCILGHLESSGFSLNTPKRQNMLREIINGFGVETKDGELFVEASVENFPYKKHSLVQAMLAVNDMFMTAQPHVATLFLQDVAHFLDDHDVRYSPSVEFTGKTGFVHKFDFLIPKSRKAPERLLRAINHPTRDAATSLLFSWTDTRGVRAKDSQFFVVLNDTEKKLSQDLLAAFKHYDVEPITWSERQRFAPTLVA